MQDKMAYHRMPLITQHIAAVFTAQHTFRGARTQLQAAKQVVPYKMCKTNPGQDPVHLASRTFSRHVQQTVTKEHTNPASSTQDRQRCRCKNSNAKQLTFQTHAMKPPIPAIPSLWCAVMALCHQHCKQHTRLLRMHVVRRSSTIS
jgi:hypothetical protein